MYIEDLFKVAVGAVGITPTAFYSCSPMEIELAIEGFELRKKQDFYTNQVALVNAIGKFFGGKHFKTVDPFKVEERKVAKSFSSIEEKNAQFDYLLTQFKKEEGEELNE